MEEGQIGVLANPTGTRSVSLTHTLPLSLFPSPFLACIACLLQDMTVEVSHLKVFLYEKGC